MRRPLFLLALAAAGCHKPDTGPAPAPAAGSTTAPARSLVDSAKPEFEQMLQALAANPADPKYKNQFLSIDLLVEEVKAEKKDSYLATGTAGPANVRVTFLTPPNLFANEQAKSLAPGDTVSFYGELGRFEPGTPRPTVVVFSGSISRVSRKAR